MKDQYDGMFGIHASMDGDLEYTEDLITGKIIHVNHTTDWVMISHSIHYYGISPLALVGIVLNMLSLWIWNVNYPDGASVLFFQASAISDAFYIILSNVWWYTPLSSYTKLILRQCTYFFMSCSVIITTLMVVCLYVSLRRPSDRDTFFSSYRIKLAIALIASYCFTGRLIEGVVEGNTKHGDDGGSVDFNLFFGAFLIILPLLIQFGFLGYIVYYLANTNRVSSAGGLDRTDTDGEWDSPANMRSMTFTVIAITIAGWFVVPLEIRGIIYDLIYPGARELPTMRAATNLIHIVDAGVNFIFYCCFYKSFLQMLKLRLIDNFTTNFTTVDDINCSYSSTTVGQHQQPDHSKSAPSEDPKTAGPLSVLPNPQCDRPLIIVIEPTVTDDEVEGQSPVDP